MTRLRGSGTSSQPSGVTRAFSRADAKAAGRPKDAPRRQCLRDPACASPGRSHSGNIRMQQFTALAHRRGRERSGRQGHSTCLSHSFRTPRGAARRYRARPLAKISVFLTGSFGYGKKWQADFYKRPHYRQTVEETIAQRLSLLPMRAGVRGYRGACKDLVGCKKWWGQERDHRGECCQQGCLVVERWLALRMANQARLNFLIQSSAAA
jgi:hypothetical protein